MRVLSIGVNLVPQSGGTYRTVRSFVSALENKRHDVQVINFSKYRSCPPDSKTVTFHTTKVPLARAGQWCWHAYGGDVRSLIQGVDLVFIHGVYVHPLVLCASLANRYNIPYVLVPHGSLDPQSLVRHRWRKKMWLALYQDVLFRKPAAVLYATEVEMRRSWAAGRERRAVYLPWGTVTACEYEKQAFREQVRARHGIPQGRRIALFCGRMTRVKRPIETIRAFVREAPADWVLLCVGPACSDVPIEEISALCKHSEGRCTYVGPVLGPEISEFYKAADLCVLLSYSENFSHTVAESLAYGVPVVVSPGIGLSAYVRSDGGGFVACGESFEDMCAVLRLALSRTPVELEEAGRLGKNWVRRELSVGVFADRLEAVCRSAVNGARAGWAGAI